ncbi:MAG: thiopeptide-type bacteriocin biosynthesis protein [Pseudonocardia sp.]
MLSELGERAQWWFLRYHDPEEHLRLRLRVPADSVAATATQIGAWTQGLRRAGLIARVQWDTYFPETARFGGEAAMAAAEAYFAADSATALAQLTASAAHGGPDRRALTAASMLDIVIALLDDPGEAMRWLIAHTRPAAPAPPRSLYAQAIALANPNDPQYLAAQPGCRSVISCWARRRHALAAYRRSLQQSAPGRAAVLLPDLLHLHHIRMARPSLDGERACLHLARAAALSWNTRPRKGSCPNALAAADFLAQVLSDPHTAWAAAPPAGGRAWPRSLAGGAAGIALLHIERAHSGHGDWATAHTWLSLAASGDLTAAANAGLYFGAPALAFATHAAAGATGRYQRTLTHLDEATIAITRRRLAATHARIERGDRPEMKEFDLIRGLAGLGTYHLKRRPDHQITSDVLTYLVWLTKPLPARDDGLPGWWTNVSPNGESSPEYPHGHGNFGLSHGISVISGVKLF